MGKNILSDTDYTKGWDSRFGVAVVVGQVSEVVCDAKRANVRVIMPDRLDHNDQPLISKPVPVMQIASLAKKSFAMPRIGTNVLCVKLPNGTSNYAVVGSFYTTTNPPPVSDPMLDYVLYDDGSTMQFDASKGELTWKLKGNLLLDNQKDFTIKQVGKFEVDTQGDINLIPQGVCLLQAPTIHLKGTVVIDGNISHTGDMVTSGVHTDSIGHHSGGLRERELEARVAKLEILLAAMEMRVAQLEARH